MCVKQKRREYFRENLMKLYACPMKLFNPRVFSHLFCCSLEVLDPLSICALTTIFHHFFFTNYFLPFVIYLVLMKKPNNKEQITNKQNLFQLVEKFVKTQNLFFVKTCDEQLIMVYKNCSLYLHFPVGCQQ